LFVIFGIILACLIGLSKQIADESNTPVSWLILISRLLLGLPFVLYIPGYLLQGLFFPLRDDLDKIERIGLSLGLSVALIALLALLLNALPWGLSSMAILIGQSGLTLLLIIVTLIVRWFQPADQVYIPEVNPHLNRWWSSLGISERNMMAVMVGVLFLTLLAAAWIFLLPSPSSYMTEFYMLGSEGYAENFPRQANMGQSISVSLGVTNRERTSMQYRLEVWQVDPLDGTHRQLVAGVSPFTLSVGESHQWDQSWQPAWSGQDQQFEFLLYTADDPDPYRQLLLWMNIDP
jgi:uncharacterized membrane protein